MAQQITITLNLGNLRTSAVTEMYKWGEVNKNDENYQRIYHLQYGGGDNVDLSLVNLYLRQRTDRIADIISEYLTNFAYSNSETSQTRTTTTTDQDTTPDEDTTPTPPQQTVTYSLTLPAGWNNKTFASLVKLFEDYVIDGTVADWFTNAGVEQGKVYNTKAIEHATGIQRNIYKKNSTI